MISSSVENGWFWCCGWNLSMVEPIKIILIRVIKVIPHSTLTLILFLH